MPDWDRMLKPAKIEIMSDQPSAYFSIGFGG